jgi:outer membrane protein assembly factor BamB
VQGFDLETGKRIWTGSSVGEGVVPSIVIGDGLIFTTSGFGEPVIRAIRSDGKGDVIKTHIVWESKDDVQKTHQCFMSSHFFIWSPRPASLSA